MLWIINNIPPLANILKINIGRIFTMLKGILKVKNNLYIIISLVLVSIFLINFGIPAYQSLLREDVVFKESPDMNMTSPSITICENQQVKYLIDSEEKIDYYGEACNTTIKNASDFFSCYDHLTRKDPPSI